MLELELILSISLIIFSIISLSWWSFVGVVQKFSTDRIIGVSLAAVIMSHTSIWIFVTLGWIFISMCCASGYLIFSHNSEQIIPTLIFIAGLPLLIINTFSQIKFVNDLAQL